MKIPPSPPPMVQNLDEKRGVTPEQDKQIKQVAKNFEALFVHQLVGAMRKTVTPGGLVPESNAERMYKGMLDQEYSQKISDSEQLGLSKMIYDHLLRTARGQ